MSSHFLGFPSSTVESISSLVPSMSTVTVDSTSLNSFDAISYFITYTLPSKKKSFSMDVTNESSGVSDTVYGKNGDYISASIAASDNGLTFNLQVTNSESEELTVNITRMKN